MSDRMWLAILMAFMCALFISTIGLFKLPTILETSIDVALLTGFAIVTQIGTEIMKEEETKQNQRK